MAGLDREGCLLDPNPTWEKLLGWHPSVLEGIWMVRMVEAPDREKTLNMLHNCLVGYQQDGRVEVVEVRIRGVDGALRWIELSLTPSHGPRTDGLVAWLMGRDITEAKQLRSELLQARGDTARAEHTRASFLANVSHEIRTPMNGIIGVLELLKNTRLAPEQIELVNLVDESADALLALINDILEVSRIEAHGVELQLAPYEPRSLMEDICLLFAAQAQKSQISLGWSCSKLVPQVLRGDMTRLRQVLTNLAHNALKFSERGEVKIFSTASLAEQGGLKWIIGVRDTGAGIAPEDLERIMMPFVQTDTGSKAGGTGLGLSIARQLVEKMGGQFDVESTLGEGSTFYATFQLTPEDIVEQASSFATPPPSVWVISDDPPPESLLDSLHELNYEPRHIQDIDEIPYDHTEYAFIFTAWKDGLGKRRSRDSRVLVVYWLEHADEIPPAGHPYLNLPVRKRALTYAMEGLLQGSSTIEEGEEVITITMHPASLMDGNSVWSEVIEDNQRISASPKSTLIGQAYSATVNILLVEDQPINRQVAARMLETVNIGLEIETTIAVDGAQAVELARQQRFDLILMDCAMPVMDGYTAAKRIRCLPNRNADIPIIALTAYALPEERQRALDCGMDEHITKPLTLDVLERVLTEQLELIERSDEREPSWDRDRTDMIWARDVKPKKSRKPEQDHETLERLVRELGDKEIAREIILDYLEDATDRLQRIRELLRIKPELAREELSREAHTIKGASKIFALEPIIDASNFFEAEAKVASRDELALHVSTLEICLMDARVKLTRFVEQHLDQIELS
jgi:PAS domain S-box-containing protein